MNVPGAVTLAERARRATSPRAWPTARIARGRLASSLPAVDARAAPRSSTAARCNWSRFVYLGGRHVARGRRPLHASSRPRTTRRSRGSAERVRYIEIDRFSNATPHLGLRRSMRRNAPLVSPGVVSLASMLGPSSLARRTRASSRPRRRAADARRPASGIVLVRRHRSSSEGIVALRGHRRLAKASSLAEGLILSEGVVARRGRRRCPRASS